MSFENEEIIENKSFENKIKALESRLLLKYTCIGKGRSRSGYAISSYSILKVPSVPEGQFDNFIESKTFKENNENIARCRLVLIDDIQCLLMERLNTDIPSNYDFPDWSYCIDCFQVGFDRKGNLKAYDYA